jgi:hypothetical protein
MTMKGKLGHLRKVDLRDFWEREDSDFTPWLASEENIALLGEAIGLELEVQQEEASVGPFRADILCKNTISDELVIIENQLERTDHTHLGQTLTYAAGLDAVTIIWVAADFTEEHRAALDWLNRISHEDFRFFGIEIELWRIGDSQPASKFNIVAKPNDWSKTVKEAVGHRGILTEGQKSQVEYWTEFGAFLDTKGARFKPPKPSPSNWMGWGLGRSGAGLIAIANAKEILVRVQIDNRDHPSWFPKLLDNRDRIEVEVGFKLEWEEKPANRHSVLQVQTRADTRSPEERPTAFEWMLKQMDSLDRTFRPRIKDLDDNPLSGQENMP